MSERECPFCDGRGVLDDSSCPFCDGRGFMMSEEAEHLYLSDAIKSGKVKVVA